MLFFHMLRCILLHRRQWLRTKTPGEERWRCKHCDMMGSVSDW